MKWLFIISVLVPWQDEPKTIEVEVATQEICEKMVDDFYITNRYGTETPVDRILSSATCKGLAQ